MGEKQVKENTQENAANMEKKTDIKAEFSGVTDKVKESANQIWLAGLGAYAKAEKEGTKLFDVLVKDGERLETKTRDFVDRQITAAKDQVVAAKDKVDEVRQKATGSWGKVEKAFDQRVSSALHRLDIPTKLDYDEVTARIEALSERVKSLAERKNIPFVDKNERAE